MATLTISRDIYRRFISGKQGLWPGRRWQGREGVAQAIRESEFIQIDPITMLHRSHDIALWGRVDGYTPDMLMQVMYDQRQFFDWGGFLVIYPMEELPYWRALPMPNTLNSARVQQYITDTAPVIDEVRAALREKGPLGNRDFESGEARIENYRSGKLTGLALRLMWLTGELMTHSRRNFDRLYDFTENVAPKEVQRIASVDEAEDFFLRKALRGVAMTTEPNWRLWYQDYVGRKVSNGEIRERVDALTHSGEVVPVQVEHIKGVSYIFASDMPLLDDLLADRIPDAWTPVAATTSDEVTFLAPLELVSARGRAKPVFGFEYIWEVYKPVEKRRWGYYVLPVLYGDKLVARIDAKLDRKNKLLQILGFWLEDEKYEDDARFACAFANGLANFIRFHEAESVDISKLPGLFSTTVQLVSNLNPY